MTPLAEAEGGRRQILGVELFGGWDVRVSRRGCYYDVSLTPPGAAAPAYDARLKPSLPEALESLAGFLGRAVRLAPVYVRRVVELAIETETAP